MSGNDHHLFREWLRRNDIPDKDESDEGIDEEATHRPFGKDGFEGKTYPSTRETKKFFVESGDSLEKWLDRNEVYDKDDALKTKETWKYPPEHLDAVRIDSTLDLHQLTVDQAMRLFHQFVLQCYKRNDRVIRVIHGKGKHSLGGPRIKMSVIKWLKTQGKSYVRLYKEAPPRYGGSGATIIWLS